MRAISTFPQIYFCRRFVDFRKSINGLSEIVEQELKLSPFSGALFIFISKQRDKIKILYWDKTGFSIWYKRLEEAKFAWPKNIAGEDTTSISITQEQLEWLLNGIDIWKIKIHKALLYENLS